MAEHGAKPVRDRVTALLAADLPNRITMATNLWALDAPELPKPDQVHSGDIPDGALDHKGDTWIEVITPRLMPRTRSMGLNPNGYMTHRYRYSARIYVWVISPLWDDAVDLRDRTATVTRDSLLAYPTLAVPPAVGDTGFLVRYDTLAEESGEPFRIGQRNGGSPRVRAGALLNYEIEHEYAAGDPLTNAAWGTFNTLDLKVTLVPVLTRIGG